MSTIVINSFRFGAGGSFSPDDIAGLVLWLKADSLALSDGDFVGTWEDSSAAGNDASNGFAGTIPTYQTNELNGLPVVRFDGSDNLTTASITAITAWSIFFVVKSAGTGTAYLLAAGSDTTAIIHGFVGGKWEYFNSPRTQIGDISTTNFQVITSVNGGTATGVWFIGQASAGSVWAGDVAEIIAYNTALSGGDQTSVQNYLAAKYAL